MMEKLNIKTMKERNKYIELHNYHKLYTQYEISQNNFDIWSLYINIIEGNPNIDSKIRCNIGYYNSGTGGGIPEIGFIVENDYSLQKLPKYSFLIPENNLDDYLFSLDTEQFWKISNIDLSKKPLIFTLIKV